MMPTCLRSAIKIHALPSPHQINPRSSEAVAVDLEVDFVVAGVVLAGGEVADLLTAGEVKGGSGWEIELGPFEDFLGGDATSFHVVDDVINREALVLF